MIGIVGAPAKDSHATAAKGNASGNLQNGGYAAQQGDYKKTLSDIIQSESVFFDLLHWRLFYTVNLSKSTSTDFVISNIF